MRSVGFISTIIVLSQITGACAGTPAAGAAEPTTFDSPAEPAPATAGGDVAATAAAASETALLPNGRQPLLSVVTGGAPSEQQLQAAHNAGFKTVISLLPETEPEASQVQSLGMHFVSIPVAGAQDLTEENARKLGEAMDSAEAKPLLLHCASGNRAGALLSLKAFYVDHASEQDALQLGESAGLASLKPAVEAQMQKSSAAD